MRRSDYIEALDHLKEKLEEKDIIAIQDSGELIARLTNAVSVYVLNQSMEYMDYLRKESEL